MARLATVTEEGAPHQVPIAFALDGDLIYSAVDHKPKRTRDLKRLRHIDARPAVSILVDLYEDDWSRLWWCRLDGAARVEHEGSAFDVGLRALRDKYPQYREEPPAGPLIVIDVTGWTGWSASDREEGES